MAIGLYIGYTGESVVGNIIYVCIYMCRSSRPKYWTGQFCTLYNFTFIFLISLLLLFHNVVHEHSWVNLKATSNHNPIPTITLSQHRHSLACLALVIVYWNLKEGIFGQIADLLKFNIWKLSYKSSQTLTVETAVMPWIELLLILLWNCHQFVTFGLIILGLYIKIV